MGNTDAILEQRIPVEKEFEESVCPTPQTYAGQKHTRPLEKSFAQNISFHPTFSKFN